MTKGRWLCHSGSLFHDCNKKEPGPESPSINVSITIPSSASKFLAWCEYEMALKDYCAEHLVSKRWCYLMKKSLRYGPSWRKRATGDTLFKVIACPLALPCSLLPNWMNSSTCHSYDVFPKNMEPNMS